MPVFYGSMSRRKSHLCRHNVALSQKQRADYDGATGWHYTLCCTLPILSSTAGCHGGTIAIQNLLCDSAYQANANCCACYPNGCVVTSMKGQGVCWYRWRAISLCWKSIKSDTKGVLIVGIHRERRSEGVLDREWLSCPEWIGIDST